MEVLLKDGGFDGAEITIIQESDLVRDVPCKMDRVMALEMFKKLGMEVGTMGPE